MAKFIEFALLLKILRLEYIVNELVGFEDKDFQKGGQKRSSFYYDLWNIKYLSNFKWDDLTEEIAYKNATREQKLALQISAAKKERDFYLSKVDQSRALTAIEERIKKKQKVQHESGSTFELPQEQQAPKVIQQFPQTRPVDNAGQSKPRLSKESVFLSVGFCSPFSLSFQKFNSSSTITLQVFGGSS